MEIAGWPKPAPSLALEVRGGGRRAIRKRSYANDCGGFRRSRNDWLGGGVEDDVHRSDRRRGGGVDRGANLAVAGFLLCDRVRVCQAQRGREEDHAGAEDGEGCASMRTRSGREYQRAPCLIGFQGRYFHGLRLLLRITAARPGLTAVSSRRANSGSAAGVD